jgi:steroid 5-alpha reductase family enzyme
VSDFPTSAFAAALPWAAGGELVLLAATFAVATRARRHGVIDTTWGLLFVVDAAAAFGGSAGHGDLLRRWLLLSLTAVWGLRLAGHIGRRTIGASEDPRYEALLAKARGNRTWYAIRSIYLAQGGLAFVVAAPILVGSFVPGPVGVLGWIGVAVWAVGMLFETVGDRQLERFRADPANRGTVIDAGLWRYTRHPNYFGDACVWWGVFLVAAQRWPGVLTVFAPLLMTLLLTTGSGARIMERHLSGRPGWAEYRARTSAFFPLPPRRTR